MLAENRRGKPDSSAVMEAGPGGFTEEKLSWVERIKVHPVECWLTLLAEGQPGQCFKMRLQGSLGKNK